MAESVYKSGRTCRHWPEILGARRATAVQLAAKSLRELRIAEVIEQDLVVEGGKVKAYRTKVKISFKYES